MGNAGGADSCRIGGIGTGCVYGEGPSRRDSLLGNQLSNMMTKDTHLLCQQIVGVYTAPSYPLTSNRTYVKKDKGNHTPLLSHDK